MWTKVRIFFLFMTFLMMSIMLLGFRKTASVPKHVLENIEALSNGEGDASVDCAPVNGYCIIGTKVTRGLPQ